MARTTSSCTVARSPGARCEYSVAGDGDQANGASNNGRISDDASCVVFGSSATNLDASGTGGLFVHDLQTGANERVDASSRRHSRKRFVGDAAISSDGRDIAFDSNASNLVAGDTNHVSDVFVRDRQAGTTQQMSIEPVASVSSAVSADGRFVAYASTAANLVANDTNGFEDIFVCDRIGGTTTRVSVAGDGTQANSNSYLPSISTDGRFVTFVSYATNLVSGDTNGSADIFLHDCQTGTTERVSLANNGSQANGGSQLSFHQRRWPLRRLHIVGDEPCLRRYQRRLGRLRP